MNTQWTQKECSLLKELKGQETLCIQKYGKGAACAVDGQLKGLFSRIAQIEQEHLDTLTQIENGNVPQPPQGGSEALPPSRRPTARPPRPTSRTTSISAPTR